MGCGFDFLKASQRFRICDAPTLQKGIKYNIENAYNYEGEYKYGERTSPNAYNQLHYATACRNFCDTS